MNLREGTRRLALLLGGLGAIAGGVLSYVYLQPVMRQREMHRAFEQLANSEVVKEQRKTLQSPDPYASIAKPISGLPPSATLKPIPQHGRAKLSDTAPPSSPPIEWDGDGKPIRYAAPQPVEYDADGKPIAATSSTAPPPKYKIDPNTGKPQIDPNTGERVVDSDVVLDWSASIPVPSQVNKGGITTINWSHNYEVASIETSDGETLSPTPAPAAWEYLLVVLFPVAGFMIPWGVVRAIGWVGAGFATSAK